jgi:hypothetical protein
MTDKTYAQIVNECNALAHSFYKAHGNKRPDEFQFYEATHPQEHLMWILAVLAYGHIEGIDVDDAVEQLEGHH